MKPKTIMTDSVFKRMMPGKTVCAYAFENGYGGLFEPNKLARRNDRKRAVKNGALYVVRVKKKYSPPPWARK